ncbi:vitamin K epoxide reductase family protein [Nocardioides deserti]|uniref:Vitamin K epoxide reductase family protein n=1 Tax=Nocardioides deserti TaxID=1588644 RepID=A0ABR6U4P3_9ACTN|nr:vitamin K epoxide reductase family protein [Nocardioides deserti]MBC2959389.1 vitamin K epoxide reductase family protein [Nocardioides deserti]GGO73362.1 membrane protein [Nocardioides deserti]
MPRATRGPRREPDQAAVRSDVPISTRGLPAAPAPAQFARTLPWLLLLGGTLGALAAFVLTVEKLALLADENYLPTCSINPVLNCGSIMRTDQAELFGFPNPLMGLAAFPVVAATGAALLAGARLARWYWLGLQAGVTFAVVLVGWLVFQSLYRIGALCPYCMVVWAVTVPLFWYVTLTNVDRGHLGAWARDCVPGRVVLANHGVLLTAVCTLVLALVAHRFWDYWVSFLL